MNDTKSNTMTKNPSHREVYSSEQLGFSEIVSIGRYNHEKAYGKLCHHTHAGAFEICYLAKGQQSYSVGNVEYRLKGGDIFITFPDEIHSSGSYPEERGTLYWIVIKVPNRKNESWLGLSRSEARKLNQLLFSIKQRYFRGHTDMKKHLDSVFEAILQTDSSIKKLIIANQLVAFLTNVVEEGNRQDNGVKYHIFAPILAYIDEHLTENISVPLLAKKASLSISRFKMLFKKFMGVPPADFILRRKIDRASYLLGKGKHNITKIAFDLGFSSSQYFATVFKRYTGKTPSQYKTL